MSKAEDLAGLLDANGDVLATNLDNVSVAFADLTGKPTTISGYGITDAFDGTYSSLTGAPTAVSSFTNDSGYATTTYVDNEVAGIVASAPATLDTLNELAAALGDDANFSTTVTNSIATKAPLASPTFTGTVTAAALTVDTDTLHVDATNNRVGIGTTSPGRALEVYASGPCVKFNNGTNAWTVGTGGFVDASDSLIFFEEGTGERMRLDSSGNLGVGTTSDGSIGHFKNATGNATLKVEGGTTAGNDAYVNIAIGNTTGTSGIYFSDTTNGVGRITYEHNGNYMRFYTGSAEEMRLENDGDLHVDGDVIAYSTTISDIRLKDNIVGINNALAKVGQLNGYTFEYKADGKVSAGVIAQEVEAVLPEAVSEKQLPLKTDDDQDYKVVNYDALHGLLIEAIKELSLRVEALEAK